ncbi:MAG: hypothetical protein G01um1014107_243 [Parcubacteria group bacterium Gr01-1014_107]|nr:MAG: hypothetical protein G01um1014107_243 [Parcubacteria group bacterium Gr01-1014_107]
MEEEKVERDIGSIERTRGKVARWLITIGLVKNERVANKVILAASIVLFLLAIFITFKYAI